MRLSPSLSCRRSVPINHRSGGFSLIEILIGLVIGLASMLVIYHLYAVSEGQRRTIAATSEAQTSGSMALYALARDIQSAGLGFGSMDTANLGCTAKAYNSKRNPAEFEFTLLPVRIEAGAEGASDTLWVLSGDSASMVVGAHYTSSKDGVFVMVQSHAGFHAGDMLLGTSDSKTVGAGTCLLMEATAGSGTPDLAARIVRRQQDAAYKNFYSGEDRVAYRNGGSHFNLLDTSSTNLGEGALYNLGPTPTLNVWGVDSKRGLTRYNQLLEVEDNKVQVAQDIIQFKAEYGYDADGNGLIDVSSSGEWTATLSGIVHWERVLAIRIAVLMRTSQYEKDEVTSDKPRWANGSKEFAIGTAGSDWKHYRYRVYESIVPLRNTIWGQHL